MRAYVSDSINRFEKCHRNYNVRFVNILLRLYPPLFQSLRANVSDVSVVRAKYLFIDDLYTCIIYTRACVDKLKCLF